MKQLNYQTMKFTNILISTIAVALLMCSCGKDNYPEALGGYFLGTGEPVEEKPFEYQAVDMGLDVKWADCNVGAQKPWEPGQYFAWGEIQQKQNYSWTTYKFAEDSEKTQTNPRFTQIAAISSMVSTFALSGRKVYSNANSHHGRLIW